MPVTTAADASVHLDGCAGCLALLTPVAIPALIVWRLKRRIFGYPQPELSRVWGAHHLVEIHAGGEPPPTPPPPPGMDDLRAHDPSASVVEIQSQILAAFHTLASRDSVDVAWVATADVIARRKRCPRRAVVDHGEIASVSSSGSRDQVVAVLRGQRARSFFWWTSWEERWTFTRLTPLHDRGVTPVCRNCGAPVTDAPDGLCHHCGQPAPGLIGTWRVMGRQATATALFG